mgnify:CR=1 FL=1
MNLDLNYLKYFYYVAKENGFTRAAERLHVQQPVVSRAVKLLEKDLGVHLLERQRKNVILTKDGESLYVECQKIFGTLSQIQDRFASKESRNQKLSVACSDSLSFGLIETLFSVFRKDNSQFHFTHQTGSASLFLNDIESGKVDLGIFFNTPSLPRNLVKSKIADIDFHFVVKDSLKNNTEVLNSYIATYSQSHLTPEELPLFKKYKYVGVLPSLKIISFFLNFFIFRSFDSFLSSSKLFTSSKNLFNPSEVFSNLDLTKSIFFNLLSTAFKSSTSSNGFVM